MVAETISSESPLLKSRRFRLCSQGSRSQFSVNRRARLYQRSMPAVIGVLLVLAGNLLVLARRRPPASLTTSPLPAAGRSGN